MSKSIRLYVWIALLIAGCSCSILAKGQQAKIAAIDALMNKYIELDRFNGCLLVADDHAIIYQRVHGVANPATGEPLTQEHRFRLASVAKQFTGTAIMILKERGELDYDDNVRKYLPDLPYDGITIRHLLTHTSGLPDYGSLLDQHWDTTHVNTRERKIANNHDAYECLVKYRPPALFPPGDRHEYCNTGYNLLALIVERVSGQTYQEFMRTRVFDPLGMTSTFENAADGTLPDKLRARGFKRNPVDTGYVDIDWHYQNGMFGDGGAFSTITDMFKYDQALYGSKLVSQQTLKEAFSCSKLNDGNEVDYGFGWSIVHNGRGDFVAHGGGWAGFSSFFLRDYHNGNTVIQLTNMPGVRKEQLAFAIYEILHGGKYEMPKGSVAEVMLTEINKSNVRVALERYHELKKSKPDDYDFSERELNALGYLLLGQKRYADAIEIFKKNASVFPDSWNVYDSLGEAYIKSNDLEQAIRYYEKSLSLNPGNDNAKDMLERLRK